MVFKRGLNKNFKNMKKYFVTKSTKEEENEFKYLIVSFRVCCDILFRNKFLKIFLLTYISILMVGSLGNIIKFVFNPSQKLLFDITNYSFLISGLAITLLVVFSAYCGRFSFNSWKGASRYFTLFSIENCKATFFIFLFTNLILIFIASAITINPQLENPLILWWITVILISSLFLLTLLYRLFLTQYPYAHFQYFTYASNKINNMKKITEKIKAYTSIKLIYFVYLKELSKMFGKNSTLIFKLNSIYLLSLAILKLNISNPEFSRIKEYLSTLQNVDPSKDTKKFIDIMKNIEKDYSDEFPNVPKDAPIKKERFIDLLLAKVSLLFVIISIIISLLRVLEII